MVGPFSEDRDLRDIPYAPPNMEVEEVRLMRHKLPMVPSTEPSDPYQEVKKYLAASIAMPTPITSFGGLTSASERVTVRFRVLLLLAGARPSLWRDS